MNNESTIVFKTRRLIVRSASVADAQMLFDLWRDPRAMTNVGYPQGLRITLGEIEEKISTYHQEDPFGQYLIVVLQETHENIGECKMYRPDDEGFSRTDVKLLPEFWGNRFGAGVKQGLVDYLFVHTDCDTIEGTPNVNNHASIKMQKAVGARRVGQNTFSFPESMVSFTTPVHHYIYHVFAKTGKRIEGAITWNRMINIHLVPVVIGDSSFVDRARPVSRLRGK